MLTRISPALAVANWVITHSALFGDQMPMRSPRLQAERQQPRGKPVDPFLQIAVCPADLLMPDDQRIICAKAFDNAVEMHADRIADKRRIARPVHIAQLRHSGTNLKSFAKSLPLRPWGRRGSG